MLSTTFKITLIKFLLCGLVYGYMDSAFAQERREIPNYRVFGEATQDQKVQIDELLAKYQNGWADLNADTLAALHSENNEWINAFARIFRGRKPLQVFLRERLFPQFQTLFADDKPTIELKPISRRYLSKEIVVIHLYSDLVAGESSRRVHFHLVAKMQNDQWLIEHTAIMDAR